MEPSMDRLTELARRLLRQGGQTILGITGPPGAGKSTIAAAIERLVPLVVTEGNYLLMDDGAWAEVRPFSTSTSISRTRSASTVSRRGINVMDGPRARRWAGR
jgi:adenylylsulfate kinase-like enzyme